MSVRLLALLLAAAVALGLVAATVAAAQGPSPAPSQAGAAAEAQREAAAALAAEADTNPRIQAAPVFTPPAVISGPLFIGVSDSAVPTHLVDPVSGDSYPLFDGFALWASAFDAANNRALFSSGTTLYEWPLDGAPAPLGTIVGAESGANLTMVGLAYHNGVLYGSRGVASQADPEGIYTIDTTTLSATLLLTYTAGPDAADIGGLAADPATGALYGANDFLDEPGLVRLEDNGDLTLIAPYPDGQNDLDGLAIGDGRAYLVPDEPGDIYVFDFATLTYTEPITNPWTTAELFSGAGWLAETEEPGPPGITLTKTVSADPESCGEGNSLSLEQGEPVLYCFTVANTGGIALGLHDLTDSHLGEILTGTEQALLPGATTTITRLVTLTSTTTNTATWTAYNEGPADVVSATATATVTILAPQIVVTPTSLAAVVDPGATVTATLTLSNTGTAALDWTATLAPASCDTPGDVPWATVIPTGGSTAPGAATALTVTFDAAALLTGEHDAVLCLASDDADEPLVSVPLSLTVGDILTYIPIVFGGPGDGD